MTASGSNISNIMNFDQNFDETCVGNMASNWTFIFCFKILTVFLIVYGALLAKKLFTPFTNVFYK